MDINNGTGEQPVIAFDKPTRYPVKLIDRVNHEQFEWLLWMANDASAIYSYERAGTMYIVSLTLDEALSIQGAGGMSEGFRIARVHQMSMGNKQ